MTDISQATLADAKSAVTMFWTHRACLPDSCSVNDAIDFIRDVSGTAKAQGRKITPDEWVSMAEVVDDACIDECLPTLFEVA
mgnify:FL=1